MVWRSETLSSQGFSKKRSYWAGIYVGRLRKSTNTCVKIRSGYLTNTNPERYPYIGKGEVVAEHHAMKAYWRVEV
jgi:hypothetical protein